MKYTDLSINLGFQRNMRETSWLKLFPHWWSENDPLTDAIGKEIELIKAKGIFKLLNATIKPAVMIWQNSINNKKYTESVTINNLDPEIIKLPAPLYKTFGTITLTNHTIETISELEISLNDNDSLTILDSIDEDDVITINVSDQEVYINKEQANTIIKGDGLSYFKTSQNNETYDPDTPLHNEALILSFYCPNNIADINIDVDITLENAVFNDEQNIEVTGLELIPIKKVELYAYYDFTYNTAVNGWRKVYQKEYDVTTNVIYDMITTQFFTKKFYVKVYYKGLDYPFTIGFPCDKDEPIESIYHVNRSLDRWGVLLGMPRRKYKVNIPEEDYPFTFPRFYPFNIEQDFWYYSRLINEYAWNDLAINEVDLIDTNGDPIVRLHSIDPFIQDFVIYAKSLYPEEKENIDYLRVLPNDIEQEDLSTYKRSRYYHVENLLKEDNNKADIVLSNKAGTNISNQLYISKKLKSFFELKDLPEDIDITDIQVLVQAESTDNSSEKFSNSETGLIIKGISDNVVFPMTQSSNYELEQKEIEYSLTDGIEKIKRQYSKLDANVIQKATIKPFKGRQNSYINIPFTLRENDTIIDDITEVYVTYDGYKTYKGEYKSTNDNRYIKVFLPALKLPENDTATRDFTMSISCKTYDHSSFVANNIPIQLIITNYVAEKDEEDDEEDDEKKSIYTPALVDTDEAPDIIIQGPMGDEQVKTMYVEDAWHTGDLRNILQKDGVYFVNVYENNSETNTPAILIKNIILKVSYKFKEDKVRLITYVTDDNVTLQNMGQLHVHVMNQSDKKLKTQVDIVSATNIKLSETYIDIDLEIGESLDKVIDITPEYPISDGIYDIVTTCGDQVKTNTVSVTSNGLDQTGIIIKEHYGSYNDPLRLSASVTNLQRIRINGPSDKMTFYIDGYKVGEVKIDHNDAQMTILPKNLKFLNTGLHKLDAVFSGNSRFASSRASTTLIIAKENAYIDITTNSPFIYGKSSYNDVPYAINTFIYNIIDGEKIGINEGTVSFLCNDDPIGTIEIVNGNAILPMGVIKLLANEYTITAIFNGTETYIRKENSIQIEVIGGETKVEVPNIVAKPSDTITLKAKVSDINNKGVKNGQIVFKIVDGEETKYMTSTPINVDKGIAYDEYIIDSNILQFADEDSTKEYDIHVTYTDDTGTYQSSTGDGKIIIQRGTVVIDHKNVFFGSMYEPLGFYITVNDIDTGEPVTDGHIELSIPPYNITTSAPLDADGGARLIYDPITFTADDFNQLLNFFFRTGGITPYLDEKNNPIIAHGDQGFTELLNDEGVISFNTVKNLKIVNGEITYDLEEINGDNPLSSLNGSVKNLRYENGEILYNIFETENTTLIKNLNNFTLLEGVVIIISYDNNIILSKELSFPDTIVEDFDKDNLYRFYDGPLEDLFNMDFKISENNEDLIWLIFNNNSKGDEQLFINDDYLYARTNIDTKRIYPIGTYDVDINYIADQRYKSKYNKGKIKINEPAIDIDIHSQDITYNDIGKSITCYVTEYNLTTDQTTIPIESGKVHFYVDDNKVSEVDVSKGLAVLSSNDLFSSPYGKHLLKAVYIPEDTKENTYTYSDLQLHPIPSYLNVTEENLNRRFKGKKSKLDVTVYIEKQYNIPITGTLDIYLDDKLIISEYLLGLESFAGNISREDYVYEKVNYTKATFFIDMPDDIDVEHHTLTIKYSGNEQILPSEDVTLSLDEKQLPVTLQSNDVYVATNNNCHLKVNVMSEDHDMINDGEIILTNDSQDENIIARGYVKNNVAYLDWLVTEEPRKTPYRFKLQYVNGTNYFGKTKIEQKVYVCDQKSEIYIIQDQDNIDNTPDDVPDNATIFNNINDALQCLADYGNLYIVDNVNIEENITLNKNINIIGVNNASITKDIRNILNQDDYNIRIYNFEDFDDIIYEIKGLTIKHINEKDFHIIDTDIFFVENDILIPIFLLSDGSFYSYKQLALSTIISNISLSIQGKVTISNVHLKSLDNDNKNDLIILNYRTLSMNKCIIDPNITINNQGRLKINTSAIYGNIVGSNEYDLDNNWWGSNTVPNYNVNSNIILTIDAEDTPPVIGNDINIVAKLVSTNGIKYDLPSLPFVFESEVGILSTTTGFLIENEAHTVYTDNSRKDLISCSIDDEKVYLDIFDYDKQTEIITDYDINIPVGYQADLTVKVQSVADRYYKFDENGKIIKTSNDIKEGFVTFYINQGNNKEKIGYIPVNKGLATLPIFISSGKARQFSSSEIEILAEYKGEDYYFDAKTTFKVNLIDPNSAVFVSPNGRENGVGTFNDPFSSIRNAISSDTNTIYLKSGEYKDYNINVDKEHTIKKLTGECLFTDKEHTIFIGDNDTSLTLYGLSFIGHHEVIKDIKTLTAEKCIFENNEKVFTNINEVNISYSAIIENENVLNNCTSHEFEYCWFGTNTPPENLATNKYVIMSFNSSKNPIYKESVAFLTADIDYYMERGRKVKMNDNIPLRVAHFSTIHGSLMPLSDYTYNNKATTLLNTNEDSNSNKIILSAPKEENTNYINNPLSIICYIKDEHGENKNSGKVKFEIINDETNIIEYVDVHDGIALLERDTPLPFGNYKLICSYQTFMIETDFDVKVPSIIVKECNIEPGDYIYNLSFDLTVTDSLNDNIINQDVYIYIDETFITKDRIENGVLNTELKYDFIDAGEYSLIITTKGLDTEYEEFEYKKQFTATKKDVRIEFGYKGIPKCEPIDLIIKVYDKDNRLVRDGSIIVKYDNEIVYVDAFYTYSTNETPYDSITLQNGVAIIYGFYSTYGQHSISIDYSGNDTTYNRKLFIKNDFNVGISGVIIESEQLTEQLNVNIGKTFELNFPIKDIYGNLVRRGNITLKIDHLKEPLNEEPIPVNEEGYVIYKGILPLNTKPIDHDFTIIYEDIETEKYATTTYETTIKVRPITVEIKNIDTIYAYPNSEKIQDYNVIFTQTSALDNTTFSSNVSTGELNAYYNGQQINIEKSNLESTKPKIKLNIPLLSSEEIYDIVLKYNDVNGGIYAPAESIAKLIIQKEEVKITTEISEAFPRNEFNYNINIKDHDDKNINVGSVTLYIDGVEIETKEVENGVAKIIVPALNIIKDDYKFTVVYNENEYYSRTSETFNFKIKSLTIDSITTELKSAKPNEIRETILNVKSLAGYIVDDGFVDILINNEKINTYAVTGGINYINLNIPDIPTDTYDMIFNYYGSATYNDTTKIQSFEIEEQKLYLSFSPLEEAIYTAQLNDILEFNTYIKDENGNNLYVDGILEYYLETIDKETEKVVKNPQFMGMEQIERRSTIPFRYQLPGNIEQTGNIGHRIVVYFRENNQYANISNSFMLKIIKNTPTFIKKDNEFIYISSNIKYQDILHIAVDPDIENDTPIKFLLDDNQIGYKMTKDTDDEGYISIDYKLLPTYKPGSTHTIKVVIDASLTMNHAEVSRDFTINKATPNIGPLNIEAYANEEIQLPSNVTGVNGLDITTGTLKYIDSDGEEIALNKAPNSIINYVTPTIQENSKNEETVDIKVIYTPGDNDNLYNELEENITITYTRSVLSLILNDIPFITRGVPQNIVITPISDFVKNIPDITYTVTLNVPNTDIFKSYGKNPTNIIVPKNFPDSKYYNLIINMEQTSIFKEFNKTFEIINKNEEIINVKNTDELTLALDLVADNGTINIEKDIINTEQVEIINNKNIKINGKNHKITKCNIQNNGKLTINNLTFENSNTTAIITTNELKIEKCNFINNGSIENVPYGGAIYINNRNENTYINECTFNKNKASVYGGAIFSNKGNDVIIQNSTFNDNNQTNNKGSSIASNGNIYISHNTFYKNAGRCEIYVLNGACNIINNYFDGAIAGLEGNDATTCNLNYWGYNDIKSIANKNPYLKHANYTEQTQDVKFDTYLISRCSVEYTHKYDEGLKMYITPLIDQYRNRLENEINNYDIDFNAPIIFTYEDTTTHQNIIEDGVLNDQIPSTRPGVVQIGQQTFNISGGSA